MGSDHLNPFFKLENTVVIKAEKGLILSQDSGEFHSSFYSFVL